MAKKSKLLRNRKFPFFHKELKKLYSEAEVSSIVKSAERHYEECEKLCAGASKGEWEHLSGTILPTVAIYKALQEISPNQACVQAYNIMMDLCRAGGAAAGGMLKIPGMKSFFMWLLPKMAVKLFGPTCGFRYENYSASKNKLQMDMTACPYCRYAEKLACPELKPVFCDSDIVTYGNLPGIRFERTQMLGTGGTKCDFRFIKE